MSKRKEIIIPSDVPFWKRHKFRQNMLSATYGSGKLMLFAGDQKVEHLNDDFVGRGISEEDADPEHMFRIASKAHVGAFATQPGLISRYGRDYKDVNYVAKLNSKTKLVTVSQKEPYSKLLWSVDDVVELQKSSKLNIVGVGYTIYLGSEYEERMLSQAARVISDAHKNGLIAILWIYPRGKAVKWPKSGHMIAGACGVAASLGADFVKVNYPEEDGAVSKHLLKEAVLAAGRTNVICAGGSQVTPRTFFDRLHDQLDVGAMGNATGRNIHQKDLDDAVRFCNAVTEMVVKGASSEEAYLMYSKRDD